MWIGTHWGESKGTVLYGSRINPDGVCPNGEHTLLPLFGARVGRTQAEGATIKCPVFYWTRVMTMGLHYRSYGFSLDVLSWEDAKLIRHLL